MAFICLHNESIYEMQDNFKASERGMAKWAGTVEDKVLKSLVSICSIGFSLSLAPS